MIYAYMRASNGDVDLNNQRKKIARCDFASQGKIEYISDTVSSGQPYEKRQISLVVEKLTVDDVLLVAELSRMARNTEEVLMIARLVVQKGAKLHILNPQIDFDGSLSSDILLTVLGLASNIERYYIRSRTRIAFEHKKQEIKDKGFFVSKAGKRIRQLGTIAGSKKKLKLEDKIKEVHGLISKGVNQASISKIYGVSRHTVRRLLERFPFVDTEKVSD